MNNRLCACFFFMCALYVAGCDAGNTAEVMISVHTRMGIIEQNSDRFNNTVSLNRPSQLSSFFTLFCREDDDKGKDSALKLFINARLEQHDTVLGDFRFRILDDTGVVVFESDYAVSSEFLKKLICNSNRTQLVI